MKMSKIAGALLVVAVLGTAGFFAGRVLVGGGTEAQQPNLDEQLDELEDRRVEEEGEERFAGELLGLYIAPSNDQVPLEFREEGERLNAGGCEPFPLEEAGAFALARPLVMPEGYAVAEFDSANTGQNPWALACGGTLYSRGWDYTTAGAEGIPATVGVVRSFLKYDTQDVAASRVSTQVIGGRQAIVIRPLILGGLAERVLIYFPEPFGRTSIHTFNLSEAEALKVAEAVAEATR